MNRPFIQSSIVELEKLYEQNIYDINILMQLFYELRYRKTKRAIVLLDKVFNSIDKLNINNQLYAKDIYNNLRNDFLNAKNQREQKTKKESDGNKRTEEQRKQQEQQRAEEQRKQQEQQQAEEQRKRQEQQRAEEQRKRQEQQRAEEQHKRQEQQRAEEQRKRQEQQEQQRAEEQRNQKVRSFTEALQFYQSNIRIWKTRSIADKTKFRNAMKTCLEQTNGWQIVLNIPNVQDLKEIQAAYRRLALEMHPDRGGDVEIMKLLNSAMELAKNSIK